MNLTDNEIIIDDTDIHHYLYTSDVSGKVTLTRKVMYAIANLIKRLQAENEELRKENIIATQKRANIFEIVNAYERGRTEALKEFVENSVERVEKAKLKYQRLCKEQGEEMEEHISILFDGIIGIINNLLKEMEQEENVH